MSIRRDAATCLGTADAQGEGWGETGGEASLCQWLAAGKADGEGVGRRVAV